jgi:hypothetical protein
VEPIWTGRNDINSVCYNCTHKEKKYVCIYYGRNHLLYDTDTNYIFSVRGITRDGDLTIIKDLEHNRYAVNYFSSREKGEMRNAAITTTGKK